MISLGVDIGSLTAKAAVLRGKTLVTKKVIPVAGTALASAELVVSQALAAASLTMDQVTCCCATGYGRFNVPFAQTNKTEIACHGLGAYAVDRSIRTVIDIGGQDAKVIAIDDAGMVTDFVMNEKCAAGTGRSLEILSKTLGVSLGDLSQLALRSRKDLAISNVCSIFMEMEVLRLLYKNHRKEDIARAINAAVAKRIATLARPIPLRERCYLSGGVAKNTSVKKLIESLLKIKFIDLDEDPQAIGAIGAAHFATMASIQPIAQTDSGGTHAKDD